MRILYLDLISGVSGDMLISSLLSLGVSFSEWQREVEKLNLPITIKKRLVPRGHIKALLLTTKGTEKKVKSPKEFFLIIKRSGLKKEIKEKAGEILSLLLRAEAKVHHTKIDKSHLHELAEYDTIFDIVGTLLAIDLLAIKEIYSSPVPLGKVKAPVTLEILKGIPVYEKPIDFELTTPTGASLVRALSKKFLPLPLLTIEKVGYGTGSFDLETPNLLRAIVGELKAKPKQVFLVETNIDNMSPEILGYVMERLFREGARDVFFTPIYAKKSRPAIKISALVSEEKRDEIVNLLFKETKTLGIRLYPVERYEAEREIREIKTEYGKVKVKIGRWQNETINYAFEYESLKKIAEKKGLSLKTLYEKLSRYF